MLLQPLDEKLGHFDGHGNLARGRAIPPRAHLGTQIFNQDFHFGLPGFV